MDKEARRRAILDAALAAFSAQGFAAARLDDVARGAGVAKGTLYLYFADKEALFRGLVEEMITPVLLDADAFVPLFAGTTRELLDALLEMLIERILDRPAQAIIRLMISEGPRFPELAAYYHREVVARAIALLRQVARRARERGEITSDAAERFPQLIIAPAILAVVWNALFGAIDPLDPRALLRAHRDLLLAGLGWKDPCEARP
ncbi:TetR/AcrR family transcriptional regulator [Xanthobacter sp. KR7-225]|uniref:TetR/AcrR family transcriptional regulator n=1 Tax=Xanthobacter sp. KR7-225 TaxID=3156613 RepID=UPI0032B5DE99